MPRRILIFALASLLLATPLRAEERLRVGVLAYLGAEHSMEDWAATIKAIAAALPDQRVEVVPRDHKGLADALEAGELDFVLTNPGHYVELEVAHGISRIVTRQSDARVASAIVVRADRGDLRSLEDLRGKRIAIVGETAFGGYQVAWRELAEHDVDPRRDLALVDEGLPMTRVLAAVLGNEADAGIVRGCLVEQRIADGSLAASALRVLAPVATSATPCAVSSRVYPDSPLSKARQTSPQIAKKVATALLTYEPRAGEPGWTVPVDYQPVHELFRVLRIGPYVPRPVSIADLVRRYWRGLALLVAARRPG